MRSFFGVLILFVLFIILEILATGKANASDFEKSSDADKYCYKTGITVEEMKLLIGEKHSSYKGKIKEIKIIEGSSAVRKISVTIQTKTGLQTRQVEMNPCEDIISSLLPAITEKQMLSHYLGEGPQKCYNGSIDAVITILNNLKNKDDEIDKNNVDFTRFYTQKVDKDIKVFFHSRELDQDKTVIIKKCGDPEASRAAPTKAPSNAPATNLISR